MSFMTEISVPHSYP